ncbi:DUF4430 domain-containing protein [Candidatus Woesebacteria bacterium]|nr:DUF4430 domain-containing protein [Candidatus Woesebacteria bacterium]
MKNKKVIFISSALLIVIFSLFVIQNHQSSKEFRDSLPTTTDVESVNKTFKISIDYGDSNSLEEQYDISVNESVFSALEKITLDNQIPMETESYDFGVFVKSINGLDSDTEMAWIYFVNGQSGQVAADQYQLSSGDVVEWKYVQPEY